MEAEGRRAFVSLYDQVASILRRTLWLENLAKWSRDYRDKYLPHPAAKSLISFDYITPVYIKGYRQRHVALAKAAWSQPETCEGIRVGMATPSPASAPAPVTTAVVDHNRAIAPSATHAFSLPVERDPAIIEEEAAKAKKEIDSLRKAVATEEKRTFQSLVEQLISIDSRTMMLRKMACVPKQEPRHHEHPTSLLHFDTAFGCEIGVNDIEAYRERHQRLALEAWGLKQNSGVKSSTTATSADVPARMLTPREQERKHAPSLRNRTQLNISDFNHPNLGEIIESALAYPKEFLSDRNRRVYEEEKVRFTSLEDHLSSVDKRTFWLLEMSRILLIWAERLGATKAEGFRYWDLKPAAIQAYKQRHVAWARKAWGAQQPGQVMLVAAAIPTKAAAVTLRPFFLFVEEAIDRLEAVKNCGNTAVHARANYAPTPPFVPSEAETILKRPSIAGHDSASQNSEEQAQQLPPDSKLPQQSDVAQRSWSDVVAQADTAADEVGLRGGAGSEENDASDHTIIRPSPNSELQTARDELPATLPTEIPTSYKSPSSTATPTLKQPGYEYTKLPTGPENGAKEMTPAGAVPGKSTLNEDQRRRRADRQRLHRARKSEAKRHGLQTEQEPGVSEPSSRGAPTESSMAPAAPSRGYLAVLKVERKIRKRFLKDEKAPLEYETRVSEKEQTAAPRERPQSSNPALGNASPAPMYAREGLPGSSRLQYNHPRDGDDWEWKPRPETGLLGGTTQNRSPGPKDSHMKRQPPQYRNFTDPAPRDGWDWRKHRQHGRLFYAQKEPAVDPQTKPMESPRPASPTSHSHSTPFRLTRREDIIQRTEALQHTQAAAKRSDSIAEDSFQGGFGDSVAIKRYSIPEVLDVLKIETRRHEYLNELAWRQEPLAYTTRSAEDSAPKPGFVATGEESDSAEVTVSRLDQMETLLAQTSSKLDETAGTEEKHPAAADGDLHLSLRGGAPEPRVRPPKITIIRGTLLGVPQYPGFTPRPQTFTKSIGSHPAPLFPGPATGILAPINWPALLQPDPAGVDPREGPINAADGGAVWELKMLLAMGDPFSEVPRDVLLSTVYLLSKRIPASPIAFCLKMLKRIQKMSDVVIYIQARRILTAPDFIPLMQKVVKRKADAYELEKFTAKVEEAEMILTLREGVTACLERKVCVPTSILLCPFSASKPALTSTLASSDDVYRTWPLAASFEPPIEAQKSPCADVLKLWKPPVDASALTARLRNLPFTEIGKWRWSYNEEDGRVVERVEPGKETSFVWSIKPPASSNADGGLRGGGFEADALTFRSPEVKGTRSMPGNAPPIHHPQPRTSYSQALAQTESQLQARGMRPSLYPKHLSTQLSFAEGRMSTSPTMWLRSRRPSVSCERGHRQVVTAGPPIGPALLSCDIDCHMEGWMAQNVYNGKRAPTPPPADWSTILTTLPVMTSNDSSSSSSHTTPHSASPPHSISLSPTQNVRNIPAGLETTHSWDRFMAEELVDFERQAQESPPMAPDTMPLSAYFPGSGYFKILRHGGKGRFDKPDEEYSTPFSYSDYSSGSEAGPSTRATSFTDDTGGAELEVHQSPKRSRKSRRRVDSDGDWTPMRGGALNADGHGHPDIELSDADAMDDEGAPVDEEAEEAATILGHIAGQHFVRLRRNAVSAASDTNGLSSTPAQAQAGDEPAHSAMRTTARWINSTQMSFGDHTVAVPSQAAAVVQASPSGRRGAISFASSRPSTPPLRPTTRLQVSEDTRRELSEHVQAPSFHEMRRRIQGRHPSAVSPPSSRGPNSIGPRHDRSRVIPRRPNTDHPALRFSESNIEEGEIMELAPIDFNMGFEVPLRDPRQNPRIPPGATASEVDETFGEEDERIYQAATRAGRMTALRRRCDLEGRMLTLEEGCQALGLPNTTTRAEIIALLDEDIHLTRSRREQDERREADNVRVSVDEGRAIAACAARLAAIRRAGRAGQAPTMAQMREASGFPPTARDADVIEELNSWTRHVQEERRRVQTEREEREREAEIATINPGRLISYRVSRLQPRRRAGHVPTSEEMREALGLPYSASSAEVIERFHAATERIRRQEAQSAADSAAIDRRIAEGEARREERRERHAALRAVASRWDLPEYAQLSDTDSRASSTIALERVLAAEVAEEEAAAAEAARKVREEAVQLLDTVHFDETGGVHTRAWTGGGIRGRASSIARVAELMSDSDGDNNNPLNPRPPTIQGDNRGFIANPLRPAATREGNARAVFQIMRQRNPEMFQEYERRQTLRHPATRVSAEDMVQDALQQPSTPPTARDRFGRPLGLPVQPHDDAGPEAWRRDADRRPRWMRSFEDAFPTARIGGIAVDRQAYTESLIRSTAASGHGAGERGGVPEGIWYTCTFRRRIEPKTRLKSDISMVSRSGHVSNPATYYMDYVSEPESDEDEEFPFYEWEAMFPAAAIKDMLRSTDASWGWKAVRARDWALEEMAMDPKSEGACQALGEWWERVRGMHGAAGDTRVRRVDVRVLEP